MGRVLWYHLNMATTFTDSAGKHHIPQKDALHAIFNAEGYAVIPGRPGELTQVFVGLPHPQAARYIEVIAASRGGDIVIFHVMELSGLYRHLLRRKNP